jgi:hypothetical protein
MPNPTTNFTRLPMKRITTISDAGSIPAASTNNGGSTSVCVLAAGASASTYGGALVSTGSLVVRGGNEQATVSEGANHNGQEPSLDHAEERGPYGLRVRRLNSGIAGSARTWEQKRANISMPFGPFAGRPVSELPDWYLYQLVSRRLWPDLSAAVDAELEIRAWQRRAIRRAA